MRNYKKKIAAAAAGTLLLVTVAYAATAGSKDDPLVTLSYLNNVFAPKLESSAKDAATAQKNQMTQQMNNSLADWERRVNEQLANGGQGSAEFSTLTLSKGQSLVCGVGTEVLLRSGGMTCTGSDANGLTDTTAGATLAGGKGLTANHLYMVSGGSRTLSATANGTVVLVRGSYSVK